MHTIKKHFETVTLDGDKITKHIPLMGKQIMKNDTLNGDKYL